MANFHKNVFVKELHKNKKEKYVKIHKKILISAVEFDKIKESYIKGALEYELYASKGVA